MNQKRFRPRQGFLIKIAQIEKNSFINYVYKVYKTL